MQLEGHGSYWKAKILKIQEIQFFVAVIEKKRFFWPELPRVTLCIVLVFVWGIYVRINKLSIKKTGIISLEQMFYIPP